MSKAKDGLLAYLQDALRETEEMHVNSLSDGSCNDLATYKYNCGIVHGLRLAEGMLLDLDEMQHRQDFDEEEHAA